MQKISGKSLMMFAGLLILQLATNTNFLLSTHIMYGVAFLFLGIALSRFRLNLVVNPIINYIGTISFSMYLMHFAVLQRLSQFHIVDFRFQEGLMNYGTRLLVAASLTVILSSISYIFVEVPFQKLGKKIIERWEKKTKYDKVYLHIIFRMCDRVIKHSIANYFCIKPKVTCD